MTFTFGQRVWWWDTAATKRHGVVTDFDGFIGVRTDRGVVYVNPEYLHTQDDDA